MCAANPRHRNRVTVNRKTCFSPLHIGEDFIGVFAAVMLALVIMVSVPFISGKTSLDWYVRSAECNYHVSVPFISGKTSLDAIAAVDTCLEIRFSPLHIGEDFIGRSPGRIGPKQYGFSPLHIGEDFIGSQPDERAAYSKLVSVPFISGKTSLGWAANDSIRSSRSFSPLHIGEDFIGLG